MSMRMCSLASSVHGEHSKKTMLKSTHCNSSQEFDDVSKILRTLALTAETITAASMSHAIRLPTQVVAASITRVTGSNAVQQCIQGAHLTTPLYRPLAWPPAGLIIFAYIPTPGHTAKPNTLIRCRIGRQWRIWSNRWATSGISGAK